jgi:hypothetical protein
MFEDFLLEDPVLFDGLVTRMIEDLDLAVQVVARTGKRTSITPRTVTSTLQRLDLHSLDVEAPESERSIMQLRVREVTRGPELEQGRTAYAIPERPVFEPEKRAAYDLPERPVVDPEVRVARVVSRGPLPYRVTALHQVGDVVAAAEYDFLRTGAQNAHDEQTQIVKLRHYLPACEKWPWPLNRWC